LALSDPKQVLELSDERGGNHFILRSEAPNVEQCLNLLEGNNPIRVQLPLSATVNDLLQDLKRPGYVHFEQRGARVFNDPAARLGSYALTDEAVTFTVMERTRVSPLDPSTQTRPNVVMGSFLLAPDQGAVSWAFPEDAVVSVALSRAIHMIKTEPGKKYALTQYGGDKVLQERMLLKDVPEPRDLMVVEVVDISVLPQDAPPSEMMTCQQLIADRPIADLKTQVHCRFPNVEICSQDGEILGNDLKLGDVARFSLPLRLIPKGSVRCVRIEMEHHKAECPLLDERANAEEIRNILRRHYRDFSSELLLFEGTGELDQHSLVRDIRGDITVSKRRSSASFQSGRSRDHFPQVKQFSLPKESGGQDWKLPGQPSAARSDLPGRRPPMPNILPVIVPVHQSHPAATTVSPPFPPSPLPTAEAIKFTGPSPGYDAVAQRTAPASEVVRPLKPSNYDDLLKRLEDQSQAGHRNCARCFNFHGYNFDRALADLRSGPGA
jgi:hypothetical protein